MSNQKKSNRRQNQTTVAQTQQDELKELEGGVEGQESDALSEEGTGDIQEELTVLETKTETPAPKTPAFASSQAPTSTPHVVKLFTELVGEYAKANTARQMDATLARQATRGLCTAFQQLTKLNGNDTKSCLKVLDEAIRSDKVGAFDEGVMFRHVSATKKPRLVIDMLNLAKRYVNLGEAKANITKVVDVDATAEHYTSKVVSGAIVEFYK